MDESEAKAYLQQIFKHPIPGNRKVKVDSVLVKKFCYFVKKYNGQDARTINYVDYIEDSISLYAPKSKSTAHVPKGKQLIEKRAQFQQWLRWQLVPEYYRDYQNSNLSPEKKGANAHFYFMLLDTAKKIFGEDVITKQDDFIKDLIQHKNEFQPYIARIDEQSKNNLSEQWIYTPKQLNDLSEKLFELKFTDSIQGFSQGFGQSLDSSCNWVKGKPALLYLFWLLYHKRNSFPNPIFKLIEQKFKFKGNPTTTRVLNTQKLHAESNFHLNHGILKGQYLEIYNACFSVFGNLE